MLAPAAVTLHYWTGNGGNGYWSNPANWSGTVPTTSNHRAIFPANATHRNVTNNYLGGITLESVWIYAPGYNFANGLIRTDYVRADYAAGGTSTFRTALSTTDDLQLIVDNNNSTLVIPGNIQLNSDNLSVTGNGNVTHQGVLSGTGNLYKSNFGDLRLEGLGANTFAGGTFVTAGILRLNRYLLSANFTFHGATAIPGDLYVGQGSGGLVGDVVALHRDNQIANTSKVSVLGSGSLELNNHDDSIGGLELRAGTVITGLGTLTLGDDVTVIAGTQASVISGNLNLGTATRRVFNVAALADLNVPAVLSGPAGTALTKTNRGDLYLSGANTYAGDTIVQSGELHLQGAGRPGNATGGTVLEGGRLRLWTKDVPAEPLVVSSISSLASEGGLSKWNGNITLNGPLQVETAAGSQLTINASVLGTATLYKAGEGTLTLGGTVDNLCSGATAVLRGVVELAKPFLGQPVLAINGPLFIGDGDFSPGTALVRHLRDNQIADTSAVSLAPDGTLNLNGWSDTFGDINMEGGTISAIGGHLTMNGSIYTHATDSTAFIHGPVDLGNASRNVHVENGSADPDLVLNTAFAGPPQSHLIKLGAGTATFTGDVGNTYAGATYVHEGTLLLQKLPGLIAISGELIIGDNAGGWRADVVRLGNLNQIADSAPITIMESGFLDLNNHDETVGPLGLVGPGNIETGLGTLRLNDNLHAYQSDMPAAIAGRLSLGASTRTFHVDDGLDAYDLRIDADITGSGNAGIEKTGDGTLRLAGVSSFPGQLHVAAGMLAAWDDQALGTEGAGTVMDNNTSLLLGIDVQVGEESLDLGDQTHVWFSSEKNAWAGPIQLQGATTISATSAQLDRQLQLSGPITGPGSIHKTFGTLLLSGDAPNSYLGSTTVHEHRLILGKTAGVVAVAGPIQIGNGTLTDEVRLDAPGQIGDLAAVTLSSSGVLDLNGHDEVIGSLAGAGHVQLGQGDLATGANHADTTFSGVLQGTGRLAKSGAGRMILSGTSTYTGETRVDAGTLELDGFLASGLIAVREGATLAGTGTAQSVQVQSAAFLAPGPGMGTFHVDGNLTLHGTLKSDLGGTGCDHIQVGGSVDLNGASLQLTAMDPPAPETEFMLINALQPAAIAGVFQGMPEAHSFTQQGWTVEISYVGGTGNDVELTSSAPPSPEFSGISRTDQGDMVLSGTGWPGMFYLVEATFSLNPPAGWTLLGSVQADDNGAYQFIDTDAHLYPRRFYRVSLPE